MKESKISETKEISKGLNSTLNSILFCPYCNSKLAIKEAKIGRKHKLDDKENVRAIFVKCPTCNIRITYNNLEAFERAKNMKKEVVKQGEIVKQPVAIGTTEEPVRLLPGRTEEAGIFVPYLVRR